MIYFILQFNIYMNFLNNIIPTNFNDLTNVANYSLLLNSKNNKNPVSAVITGVTSNITGVV